MKRTDPADPLYEAAMMEGLAWLSTLGQVDWQLLESVYGWIGMLLDAADTSCEDDGITLTVDRLGLNWERGYWPHHLAPQLELAREQGVSNNLRQRVAWLLRYSAGSKLVPDVRWAAELERPFRLVERYLEVVRQAPELADLIAGMAEWTGEPEDLDLLARQLSV
jgi:hypothetical protein